MNSEPAFYLSDFRGDVMETTFSNRRPARTMRILSAHRQHKI